MEIGGITNSFQNLALFKLQLKITRSKRPQKRLRLMPNQPWCAKRLFALSMRDTSNTSSHAPYSPQRKTGCSTTETPRFMLTNRR